MSKEAGSGDRPCLSCNISNEAEFIAHVQSVFGCDEEAQSPLKSASDGQQRRSGRTTQQKRAAQALMLNVDAFIHKHGLSRVGFLTLTFADHVIDYKEAQSRFNSLNTGVLSKRYKGRYIRVMERQKSGRIHYHLLVAVGADIRTGFNFVAVKNGDYRSAGNALRAEWAFWNQVAKKYRFGRTELRPIKKTAQAVGYYIGKYIGKHYDNRKEQDKGARLVSYGSFAAMCSQRFSFVSRQASAFRMKCATFAHMLFFYGRVKAPTYEALKIFNPKWIWHYRETIYQLPPWDNTEGVLWTRAMQM